MIKVLQILGFEATRNIVKHPNFTSEHGMYSKS